MHTHTCPYGRYVLQHFAATSADGDALFDALTQSVSFGGVTGLVEFNDASTHPTRLYDGDRTVDAFLGRLKQVIDGEHNEADAGDDRRAA